MENDLNKPDYIPIIRKSYEKMSEGNNIDGSNNLLLVLGHLAVFQSELANLSHTNNYFNAEIIYNVVADVSISYMYIQDVCDIDNNELMFAIKYIEENSINSVQMLIMVLAELQAEIVLFLSNQSNKAHLTNSLAKAIIATELAQKMYNIKDSDLAKIINTKLNYINLQ